MVDIKSNISFSCQRCLQPLRLDSSFDHLDEHTLAELLLPGQQQAAGDIEVHCESLERLVPPFKLTESANGSNGFMLVGDSGEVESLSHHLRVRATLFDIISGSTTADHPMCDECADSLLSLTEQQLRLIQSEWCDYNEFLKKLEVEENQQGNEEIQLENIAKELKDAKAEEERMIQELKALDKQEEVIKLAIAEQEVERERLRKEQRLYWKEFYKHRRELDTFNDDCRSLNNQLVHVSSQLERLKSTNVFNATFHIWNSSQIGTINTFRLGRMPNTNHRVDWNEINAAWGQATLLLTALARKMNLTFQRYRPVPFGNHSYIEVLDQPKDLPLYGTGGFKFLWDNKFDAAMVAFVDCLQQLKEHLEKIGFSMPYRMDRGKLEDNATGISYSIKIQFNSEEQWTKAMKLLLTNLKYGIAWASSLDDVEQQ